MNRAGAEITSSGLGLMRGDKVQDRFPGFWPVEMDEQGSPLATAQGDRIQDGRTVRPAIWAFRFRRCAPAQNQNTGFVYNFQDLTELKRLEREVATKERMAALGPAFRGDCA